MTPGQGPRPASAAGLACRGAATAKDAPAHEAAPSDAPSPRSRPRAGRGADRAAASRRWPEGQGDSSQTRGLAGVPPGLPRRRTWQRWAGQNKGANRSPGGKLGHARRPADSHSYFLRGEQLGRRGAGGGRVQGARGPPEHSVSQTSSPAPQQGPPLRLHLPGSQGPPGPAPPLQGQVRRKPVVAS